MGSAKEECCLSILRFRALGHQSRTPVPPPAARFISPPKKGHLLSAPWANSLFIVVSLNDQLVLATNNRNKKEGASYRQIILIYYFIIEYIYGVENGNSLGSEERKGCPRVLRQTTVPRADGSISIPVQAHKRWRWS